MLIGFLNGYHAAILGTLILVVAIALDFILTHDDLPGNTLRDWLIRITQKKLGAFIPFMCGALLGHFYHPSQTSGAFREMLVEWLGSKPANLSVWWGVGVTLGIGVLIALVAPLLRAHRYVLAIALFGVVVGSVIWPV